MSRPGPIATAKGVSCYCVAAGACAVALLLCLAWTVSAAQEPSPGLADLYYFVIDKSRSIFDNRLVDPIRGAAVDFVGRRSPETQVEIVFFNEASTKPRRWTSMEMKDKGTFLQYFQDAFRPAGGTRLYDTVAEVIGRVAAESGKFRQIHVVILSDGDDSGASIRYRSWQDLCDLIGQLRIDTRTTTFSWYTLGFTPRYVPPPSCAIKHFHFPVPQEGFRIAEVQPSAEFTASPMKVKVNEPVLFVLEKEGGVTKVKWDFGDGSVSTDLKARHAYSRKGSYSVSVTVEGPGGTAASGPGACVVEVLDEVPLEARFKWSPRVVRIGDEVTLVDESLGSPTAWQWKLPGPEIKSERNPAVVFRQAGQVSIELVVRREEKSSRIVQTIDVLPQPPDARFSVNPAEPEVGTVLKLKASTDDKAWRHRWTIGDIALPEQTAEVEWKVDRSGRIEILHAVEGPGGLAESESVLFVPAPLVAKFSWQPDIPRVGEPVVFRDESSGDPTSWNWEIQSVGRRSERHPRVEFTSEGEFAVTLTVHKNGRTPSVTTRTIRIEPKLVKPDASFVASPRIFTVGTTIRLVGSYDHPDWQHEWVIDHTSRLSGRQVEWKATHPGEIQVVHRVISPQGTDEKAETLLGKMELPVAKFTATPISGRSPLGVQFRNQSSGDIVSYFWDFGDGQASTEKEPFHTYTLSGTTKQVFTPTLTVTNRAGDFSKNAEPIQITVTPPPPWWKLPAIAIAILLFLLTIVWLAVRNPRKQLYGTVRWEFQGRQGSKLLSECGKSFDLAELGIEGWNIPRDQYIIWNTKRDGMHVKQGAGNPISLDHGTKFRVEGADFQYRES